MALWIIGPRHMMASSGFSWKKAIETTLTPHFSEGMIWPSMYSGLSVIPMTLATFGQSMSTSSRPTVFPWLASVTARLTDTVVFPTPPLPL